MSEESRMEHMTLDRERMSNMGYERPTENGRMSPRMGNNLGRDKLPWNQEIWNRIDQAVHYECKRTKVAAKFLPMYGPIAPSERIVPSDRIVRDEQTLSVDETEIVPVVEIIAEFKLTLQQVESEQEDRTAVTLATRAANHLSQAALLIFQGQEVTKMHALFTDKKVKLISGNAGSGLVNAAPPSEDPPKPHPQIVPVAKLDPPQPQAKWGEKTFAAVADAYARLQSGDGLEQAHYGPYALVLNYIPYADTHAPLPTTLIMPADRIKPLVTEGFYGTGTLPLLRGILVSLGGNTMDLVMGMDATTAFLQEDPDGRYRFRVFERFVLRLKDPTSVMRLEFVD
jgi:uncharacterized linocin/CFP29 family protein